ncbi:MAG TPA: TonB family protein, partial [Pyrinomonadaceae bacterium]|nr:TonB family protein [Pyrinomonadaceae bacterium]
RRLNDALAREGLKMADRDAAGSAFGSQSPETPFNMPVDDAARAGAVVGSDVYILIKGTTQRRSSFEFPEYYEASAAVFLVSSRSGRLGFWRLQLSQGPDPETARAGLMSAPEDLAPLLAAEIREMIKSDVTVHKKDRAPELPPDGTPGSNGMRPPLPYRRLKPEYTPQAYLFDVRATVDIEVEIDADGRITDTEIVRWAGYGLDESVEKTVREMNWRPADRGGKTLPMRVLLRYNFKKAEIDETEK